MRFLCLSALAVLSLGLFVSAQSPKPMSTPPDDEEVIKISTSLVQIDATVTDKKGNVVKDLTKDDFEIYQNGKKQEITAFSFVPLIRQTQTTVTKTIPEAKGTVSVPTATKALRPEQVRRAYAIVVDDLGLNFDSIDVTKNALKKFVNEQMQEGDLVAIVRTSGGLGATQSFTSDKRQLLLAIEKIRWFPMSRGGLTTFEPIRPDSLEELARYNDDPKDPNSRITKDMAEKEKQMSQRVTEDSQDFGTYGTFGALRYIIRAMKELPGRKSLVLFSEGFANTENIPGTNMKRLNRFTQAIESLTDLANRSSVVIHTVDPRGLLVPSGQAADILSPDSPLADSRYAAVMETQRSLTYIADQTGGNSFRLNNINIGLQKVLNNEEGYYLVGYQPDEETFNAKELKFNKLMVKLKNSDLQVKYRNGFMGVTDESLNKGASSGQKVMNALVSPFASNDINLNMYPIFTKEEKGNSSIQTLVLINANDLSFTKELNGKYQTNFEIFAFVFGDNGISEDSFTKKFTAQFDEKTYQTIREKGFVYEFLVPIKKSGGYQFRVALRDTKTNKVGFASQFIEVPDLSEKKLTISNLLLNNFSIENWRKISNKQEPGEDENGVYLDTTQRIFKKNSILTYGYAIYNAKVDHGSSPQIYITTRLIRDGKVTLETKPTLYNFDKQNDSKRLEVNGSLTIGKELKAGEYILQIIATDSNNKNQTSMQWIDFEVVE